MDKDLIKSSAESFEVAARDSMKESNAKLYDFANLMIKIAFGVGGISAVHIVNSDSELLYSKWGIIFFGLSVIAGGSQLLIDSKFFNDQAKLLIKMADRWKWWSLNPEDDDAVKDAKESLNNYSQASSTSTQASLVIQILFVCLGTTFVLIDVFFI